MMKFFLFLIVVLAYLWSCRKPSCARKFAFHFPVTITQGDTFNIGDTLWMKMDLDNQLIDHQTGELIDLSGFDLYFSFSVEKRDTLYVNNAIRSFELIEEIGAFRQEGTGRFTSTYAHFKDETKRELHLGIIPRKSGVYFMALSLPIEYAIAEESTVPEEQLKIIPSDCYQGIVEHSGVRFQGGAFNYYLTAQYPCQQASPTDTLTICRSDSLFMAHGGGHAFVVR